MALTLYAHPLSSYCQKALTALYENDTPFESILVEPASAAAQALSRLWPLHLYPILRDGERTIPESTIIIEYLAVHHPSPSKLIPTDADAAIDVRFMDRVFDAYVLAPQTNIVADALRPKDNRDPYGVEQSRALLDKAYLWLDQRMATRTWASGEAFTLADCAAAPALLYADWTYPIPAAFKNLWAYRTRLLERPSYARVLDEARPYRHYFPLGAPADRD